MELRQYIAVVRRRWPVVAAVVALTALFSLVLLFSQHSTYIATARLSMRQQNIPSRLPTAGQPGFYTYDNYYNWFSSEFLADDYTQIVPSEAFAERVAAKLKAQYPNLTPVGVRGMLSAERRHRELTVVASSGDQAQAQAVVDAATQVLTEMSGPRGTMPSTNGITIYDDVLFGVIDRPAAAGANDSRQRANAVIAVGVSLALGLALAFLLEYLDTSVRDSADAEQVLGLPVLGTIPGPR